MKFSRPLSVAPLALLCLGLVACGPGAPNAADDPDAAQGDGHGEIAGAAEVGEPPLALLSVDGAGQVGVLDLISAESEAIESVATPEALATDGRYAFVSTPNGLEIIDSGRWTWDHVDHFHYYRADARTVGIVDGEGPATISTGMLSTAGATGVYFAGSGEAVLLDNQRLSEGEISELFRIAPEEGGGVVAPVGDGALVANGDELVYHEADGTATDVVAPCPDASGAITTRVALAVACADGAVLATAEGGEVELERVPYPEGTEAEAARTFEGRKGRPTVAGIAGETGFWLLNTRERSWTHMDTGHELVRVVSADNADSHVVALDAAGAVRVFSGSTGEEVSATDSLVNGEDPNVALTLDDQRAYLNDPEQGVVYEIDYAGDARVARTLETDPAPDFVAEVGR